MEKNRIITPGLPGSVSGLPPGAPNISTITQYNPLNATNRPNTGLTGTDLGNGVGSFPVDINQGLNSELANLLLLADSFLPTLGQMGNYGYRQLFDKETIPQKQGTLSKQYRRIVGMDSNPINAVLKGITGWAPTWNEVTIQGTSITASINAWGRYYKSNAFQDAISTIDWRLERAMHFASNAADTLDKLASMRLYVGANKIYVNSVGAPSPAANGLLTATLILGVNASTVTAGLTFDALLEARHQMTQYREPYCTINPDTGVVNTSNLRLKPISGYRGGDYLVLLGHAGYTQVFSDERFKDSYVQNGGISAGGMLNESIGISSPVFKLRFEIILSPLTIAKSTDLQMDTEGGNELEVAFVIGGGASMIGVELSLEGYTKMIDVPYSDSKKIDPFELLAITGWMALVDFTVLQNEAIYAIPYNKTASRIISGLPIAGTTPGFKG